MKHLSIIFLVLFSIACGEPDEKLERIARVRADSLFQNEKKELDSHLDSICKARNLSEFQRSLDSIVEIRKNEILKLQQDL